MRHINCDWAKNKVYIKNLNPIPQLLQQVKTINVVKRGIPLFCVLMMKNGTGDNRFTLHRENRLNQPVSG